MKCCEETGDSAEATVQVQRSSSAAAMKPLGKSWCGMGIEGGRLRMLMDAHPVFGATAVPDDVFSGIPEIQFRQSATRL